MNTILCVDDTTANLLVLEALFEPYSDKYKIITVSGGYEALEVLLSNTVDLILLDVMMPDIDGFETAKLIKKNKSTKDIPIIFLTAKRDNQTIRDAFKYGVDYLSKPYDEHELYERVNVHIKLVETRKELYKQIEFNQAVIDSQQDIIIIRNNEDIISVNESFLNFFHIESLDEFKKTHSCVSELFMDYDNYFSLHNYNNEQNWLEYFISNKNIDHNVLLMDTATFEPKAFKVDANKIKNSDKYVINLTDITKLATQSKVFENKATYDALTNIYNRSKFNELIEEHYNLFKRYKSSLCFAIFDIDFFKKVNDNYGHMIGDETLITFAKVINDSIRNTDIFARWGGEEFVLLMPETKLQEAVKVTNKLRELIQNTHFKVVQNVTCSIGLTQFLDDDTIDDVLIRADDALYDAKQNGRNQVCTK